MKALITGGTGLIGNHLAPALAAAGYDVVVLSRRARPAKSDRIKFVTWDGKTIPTTVGDIDVIINLAGAGIADHRWSDSYKREIVDSRVWGTTACVKFIQQATYKPKVFVSASAVGYYGTKDPNLLDESAKPGTDFLAQTGIKWEGAAQGAGVRTVIPRFGIVLSLDGGAFPKLIKPFKMYAGGHLGSGKQGFPWVHIDDVVGAVLFAINHEALAGPVNVVAPECLNNKDFCKVLGGVLGKPSSLSVPSLVAKTMMGESSMLLLEGQFVTPKKLLEAGYAFKFATAESALRQLTTAMDK